MRLPRFQIHLTLALCRHSQGKTWTPLHTVHGAMPKASKKRPRDDIPCVPIRSPVWIVKSWRELPEVRRAFRDHDGIREYRMHGVFATVEAANAEARRARDRLVAKYELAEEEDEGQEEDEEDEDEEDEDEEEEGKGEEAKKVKDEEPFVYFRNLDWDCEDEDEYEGALHVVVKKHNVR